MDDSVVHKAGRPYFFTALIVRAIQVMSKWILPLHGGVQYDFALSEVLETGMIVISHEILPYFIQTEAMLRSQMRGRISLPTEWLPWLQNTGPFRCRQVDDLVF